MKGGKREGSGRKKVAGEQVIAPVRIAKTIYDMIPGNKSEFIRNATKEKLEKLLDKVIVIDR